MKQITEGIWQLTDEEAEYLRTYCAEICAEMSRKELSQEPVSIFHAMVTRLQSGGTRISEKQRGILFLLAEDDPDFLKPITIERL